MNRFYFRNLKKTDARLARLILAEIKRQKETINLIPSENIADPVILEVVGSPLMNKYSEGYPGRRYYPGNKIYDQIENLAKERLLKLFKLSKNWSVNVQSYSGSPANLAIYLGLLEPGDKIMGLSLACGGHLTHGHLVNFSGKIFHSVLYELNSKTGYLDYQQIEKLAKKFRPKIIVSGATAYPRKINFSQFGKIAKKVGAYHMADISHIAGLIISGLHPSPFPYADIVMTTTHKTLNGPRGAVIFSRKELAQKIDKAVFPGSQGGPHNNITAAKALMAFLDSKPWFSAYQKQIVKNSRVLASELKKYGFKLLTNGTDNHLMVIDLRPLNLAGSEAETYLENAGILANRNSVPGDLKPFRPSGLRLGTPAVTKRGMKEKEMKKIAELIFRVLIKKEPTAKINQEVKKLCQKFPLPY